MSKNDENFIAFCDELRAYVEEHGLFPPKHTNMLSRIKYVRKKIKACTLEDWKRRNGGTGTCSATIGVG